MKEKKETNKPKAMIKKEYLNGDLPDGNPYNLPEIKRYGKNTEEGRKVARMVSEVLNRTNKSTPVAGSKIAF